MTKTTKNAVGLAQEGHQVTRGHNDNSLDREACKQYALANGFKWQEGKKNWNPSSADSVRGCYLFASNDNVYYNHHETSGQPCSTTMVCIQDEKPDECPSSVEFRDRYLQIGKWRFGDADGRHFTVVHDGGKTVQVYTKDGKRLGADSNVTVRHRDEEAPEEIKFGDRFVQIGNFRICDVDGTHASICTVDGKTSQIFRKDGTLHPGPRDDFCCHQRSVDPSHKNAPMIGDRYIQIGEWRLGAIDDNHASMSHKDGKTAQIYRNDGTLHGTSGRTDWGCYGWSGKCGTAGPTCQLGDGKAAVRLTSLTYSTKKLCKYNSELNHIRNMTKPEDDDLKLDPVAVLPGQYSNKEPEGWSVEERTQRPYFHEYDGNTKKWVRNKALEFGPFPGKKVTVMTNGSRGFIISAGKYECDDKGENCALKYQDEVESNISFLDFAAKRKVNNRRPVLGKAMPWMKLGCAMATKIDEIDFSEFVVRHDCPPYSESDIREAEEAGSSPGVLCVPVLLPRNQGQCPSPLHPRRSYGPVAHEKSPGRNRHQGTHPANAAHMLHRRGAPQMCNELAPKELRRKQGHLRCKARVHVGPEGESGGGPTENQQPAITDKSLLRTWPCQGSTPSASTRATFAPSSPGANWGAKTRDARSTRSNGATQAQTGPGRRTT